MGDLVGVVRKLGTSPGVSPHIFAVVPPPMMRSFTIDSILTGDESVQTGAVHQVQTVINSIYPVLVPLIAKENMLDGVIDVFGGMGGVADWRDKFPDGCKKSTWTQCRWWCDSLWCDSCHPNDSGYAQLAAVVANGLRFAAEVEVV